MCLCRILRKLPSQVPLGSLSTLQTATACIRTFQAWQGPGLPPSKQTTFDFSHRNGIYVLEWHSQVNTELLEVYLAFLSTI